MNPQSITNSGMEEEKMDQDYDVSAIGEMNRIEKLNRQKFYKIIEQTPGVTNAQEYKDAYRKLYYQQSLFQVKKSRDFLEKCLQDIHPSLHYPETTQTILKAIAKVYLIELFEQAVEVRTKLHKADIDELVLEEAAYNLREKSYISKI